MTGKPCIRDTRIPVSIILKLLAKKESYEQILTSYPELEEEDILIARSGSVGRSFLYEGEPQNAIFASYLIRFKPMKKIVDPKFLLYFAHSGEYLGFINSKKHTLSQPNINAQELKSLEVPLPPLPIQHHIATELKEKMVEVEKLRVGIEKQLEAINALPQTILRKAFRGKL